MMFGVVESAQFVNEKSRWDFRVIPMGGAWMVGPFICAHSCAETDNMPQRAICWSGAYDEIAMRKILYRRDECSGFFDAVDEREERDFFDFVYARA